MFYQLMLAEYLTPGRKQCMDLLYASKLHYQYLLLHYPIKIVKFGIKCGRKNLGCDGLPGHVDDLQFNTDRGNLLGEDVD